MAVSSSPSARVLSVAVLFGLALPAQEPPPKPDQKPPSKRELVERNAQRSSEQSPEQSPQPAPLAHHCSALVMTQPQPLEPGKGGSLFIVVALQNQAVIPGNAALELTYEGRQGALELGSWAAKPARVAKLYPFYSGQLLYEDTLTIEIPVNVDPAAKKDGESVQFELDAELHDGRTGNTIVKGKLPIAGRVQLGQAVGHATVFDASGATGAGAVSVEHHDAAPRQPVGAGAFALVASDRIEVETAASARMKVRLAMPAGCRLVKDDDRDLPRLLLEGAGDGVRIEVGAQPSTRAQSVDGGDAIEVYDGEYECVIVVRADGAAATGVRNATLKLSYVACEDGGRRHAPATVEAPLAIEVVAGGPAGRMTAPAADAGAEPESADPSVPLPVSGGGDLTSFLLVGGGASLLILLVILLLARRK